MKQDKARELIKDTFENPFDKERYTWFLKNLFPDKIEFRNKVYTGNYIKEAFRNYIRKYEQIGKFEDAEGNTIDLLAVELLRGQSIERARTSQRNFIAQYLKNKNHREGALVAFYSEGSDDWRFSLIKMEYSLEKKKDELTPAKRFSFLVGKDEKSHTAQKQLTALLTMQSVPLMQEIEASFNIETVTKEFFEKYKQLFLDLHEHIEKQIAKSKPLRDELESKNIDAASFTKKLLGQIVFLYFLQKKGWLGVPKQGKFSEGVKNYMRLLLNEAIENGKTFFSQYLVYLFYEALAKEHNDEGTEHYFKKLKCRIPFLNGGLFEADYDWENITVDIPNKFFTNRNITKEGDTGDGILDVFDRYNFTVKEDEPLDKEVAVDPEMLGKVFENLLTVKDRKSKGAFYTPREIVHYMCQESLIAYLDTELNGQPTSFVKMGDEQTQLFGNDGKQGQLLLMAAVDAEIVVPKKDIETFIREGIAAIENDARVESKGEETSSYSYQLPESIRNHAKEIDKALADIRICDPAIGSGAFPVGMMNEIVKAREILSVYLRDAKQKDRTAYELKRHAIQECIYGVDIDHSAIDIAKLRLWLSLVVDEEDFHKIKPLPNLDYKIVEANSLIGFAFKSPRYDTALKNLENLKAQYFSTTEIKEKDRLRKQIKREIQPLYDSSSKTFGYKIDFDFELAFSEVFHKKKGFDIVIGNPPYGETIKENKEYFSNFFTCTEGKYEIFKYFIEKGLRLLNKNGCLTYITPDTWLNLGNFTKLRKLIIENHSIFKMSRPLYNVFSSATVDTNIFLLGKHKANEQRFFIVESNLVVETPTVLLVNEDYSIRLKAENPIINKIESSSHELGDDFEIWQGLIAYGSKSQKRIWSSEKKETQFHRKLLYGGDIGKYFINWSGEYLKYGNWLHRPRPSYIYDKPKILVQRIRNPQLKNRIIAALDEDKYINGTGSSNIVENKKSKYDLKFILAVINSELINFWFKNYFNDVNIKPEQLRKIPIINGEINQKPFISIVDKLMSAKSDDTKANTSSRERQLDIMVYHLYNLTYEEAKIIDATLSEEEWEKYKL